MEVFPVSIKQNLTSGLLYMKVSSKLYHGRAENQRKKGSTFESYEFGVIWKHMNARVSVPIS